MIEQVMPLLVHGEVANTDVDIFDREKVFIDTILRPLIERLPDLKVVMEHITTSDAVKFVESCREGYVTATVTPQNLLLNRNSLFQGGLQPHHYCFPVLKRETHRQAIVASVTSGSRRFFLELIVLLMRNKRRNVLAVALAFSMLQSPYLFIPRCLKRQGTVINLKLLQASTGLIFMAFPETK